MWGVKRQTSPSARLLSGINPGLCSGVAMAKKQLRALHGCSPAQRMLRAWAFPRGVPYPQGRHLDRAHPGRCKERGLVWPGWS